MKVSILVLLCVVVLSVLVEAKLKNKVRKQFLKAVNKYRSKVAKGKAPNGTSGSKLPKASNMYQVTWSKKLEKKAASLAKLCNDSALNTDGVAAYRQNGTVKPAAILKAAPKAWWTTFQKYGIPSLTVNGNDSFYAKIAINGTVDEYINIISFQQAIWAKSKELGCGTSVCTNTTSQVSRTFAICLFKAPLTDGQVIYKKGKKLKCPKKTKAVKKTRLCKVKGKKGKAIHK